MIERDLSDKMEFKVNHSFIYTTFIDSITPINTTNINNHSSFIIVIIIIINNKILKRQNNKKYIDVTGIDVVVCSSYQLHPRLVNYQIKSEILQIFIELELRQVRGKSFRFYKFSHSFLLLFPSQ